MKSPAQSKDPPIEVAELRRLLEIAEANFARSQRLAQEANSLSQEAGKGVEQIKLLLAQRTTRLN